MLTGSGPPARRNLKEAQLTRHRLMLSAAAAALSAATVLPAALSAARADTTISNSTSKAIATNTAGNISIDSGGSINAKLASPLITLNSNNFVFSQGNLINDGISGATAIQIDTSVGNLFPASTGVASNGLISLQGTGTSKIGILVSGGHTFYAPISLSPGSSQVISGTVVSTPASTLNIKGDGSSALYIAQGTSVTSNVLIGGAITQLPSDKSSTGGGVVIDLDGTVNGSVLNASNITGIGAGIRGIYTAGGIHSCASDTNAPSGFTCPSAAEGALINSGTVSLSGASFRKAKGVNLESGSALVIAGSVDGGVLNGGPGTSSSLAAAVLSANGRVNAPAVLIDPYQSVNSSQTTPRGPVIIGPVASTVDSTDPGFSFINRGTIQGAAVDPQVSSLAMAIRGNSTTNYTCLSAVVGSCASVDGNGNPGGGLLNTGTITALSSTNVTTRTQSLPTGLDQNVTATALDIGGFATVPNITVKAEAIDSTHFTPATIKAQIQGIGQGSAYGVFIEDGATVNTINVGRNASILAGVSTSTVSPTADIAQSGAPFQLISEAIVDRSSSLSAIINSGVIQATNTTLTPGTNAVVSNIQRAIDLQTSTRSGIQIDNSGSILGDIIFGSASNNDTINVGNTGAGGGANPKTPNVTNNASNFAVVAMNQQTQSGGLPPVTTANVIDFRSGNGHRLHIGGFGYVNSTILASASALDVDIDNNGYLFVANTASTGSMNVRNLVAATGSTLGLTIGQNTTSTTPVIQADNATLSGSTLALQFGSFVSSGYTAASTATPTPQKITLISSANVINDTSLAAQNGVLRQNTPFLFEDPNEAGYNSNGAITAANGSANGDPLTLGNGGQTLELTLLPRSTGEKNADGTAGLNLSGDARIVFPYAAQALTNDNELGATIAGNLTVYNTAGVPSSGINIPKSQQAAQQVFSQFGPDVSGGARQVAIMLTDQATGPVAARQRLLRNFSKTAGEMTLWGEEFTGQISNKGQVSGSGALTAYKDHGFGFSLGLDAGSPRGGWYGGAFTYYSGDIVESLPRASKTQSEWYMLTAYSEWSGRHVFFDTQGSLAYGNLEGSRSLAVGPIVRTAESKRASLMGALGGKGGVRLKYFGLQIDPNISLDGLVLREEGYTENGGGNGMNLQVAPYYANSLRTAIGADFRLPLDIWGVELAPEARVGYRYDMFGSPAKLKAGFLSTGGLGTAGNTMKFVGPDPDQGNTILGLGIGASTDTWHLGGSYDWVRGSNGSTTQVGVITLLARI
jgi:hypothetical protein